ncbi:FtsX-like permease family protein [Cryomorpha ignava]|uniref:FtsX-like permease family protein n=1 Tax=Cryomorpha ignava TaxID=101383 RepID=A0A7K3WTB7_9FLAO|nr:ABC transporter permease [Cryomorpha ignava]NEN24281.1 FtsX-like permease family protein [Cryomorpha ignava]
MLKNYFKIALRNLWKNRTFTALNIVGLTAAFGVAFLLSMYAIFDLSYDRFHENTGSIFSVYANEQTPEGAESDEANPIPFAEALRNEVPGVEHIAKYVTGGVLITYKDKTLGMSSALTDPEFFQIFTFPVLEGDENNLIADKNSIALTRKAATIIFGEEPALGKTVTVQRGGMEVPVTVTAILKDIPETSDFNFSALFNFKSLPDAFYADNLDDWSAHNHSVYLKLADGVTPRQFERSTRTFSELHYADNISSAKRDGAQPNAEGNYRQIKLLPVEDQSFASIKNGVITVSKTLQYIVLGIAFLILFIASVNFINMSIAKSAQRLREIGMRKTLGAGKSQLFFQLWGESGLVFLIAVVLGSLLAVGLLKPFQTLFDTKASFGSILSLPILTAVFLVIGLITLVAGGYPSLLMSKLGTLQALKGKMQNTGKNRLRDVLMVLQFSITILLIAGTLVLWQQLEFLRHKDLGFNKEQVIAFPLNTKQDPDNIIQLLRNELSKSPEILGLTAADDNLGLGRDGRASATVLGFDFKNRQVSTNMLFVDYDYAKTLDIPILQGRSFDRSFPGDSLSVVINEAMVKELGEQDALNVQFYLDDSVKYSVIGVVKDYNFDALDMAIEPITYFMDGGSPMHYVYVKVVPQNLTDSYETVKEAWSRIEPSTLFMGSFLDENIDRTLTKERMMTTMISSGSLLAIVLSCIGLFAISLLVVTQRRKEIGIRKVVGASVSTITILLTKDFLKLVALSFFIATPIAWYFSSQWLQNYVYRINLTLWVFLGAGGIALVIALATIGVRTIQAAMQNPVDSLKTE